MLFKNPFRKEEKDSDVEVIKEYVAIIQKQNDMVFYELENISQFLSGIAIDIEKMANEKEKS